MALTDLVFSRAPLTGSPVALVFGETDAPVIPSASATLTGAFPDLSFAARLRDRRTLALTGAFPPLTFTAEAHYASNTSRPTVGRTVAPSQVARQIEIGLRSSAQSTLARHVGTATGHQLAAQMIAQAALPHDNATRMHQRIGTQHSSADRLAARQTTAPHQDGDRSIRPSRQTRHQSADRVGTQPVSAPHQDGWRDRRLQVRAAHQLAAPLFAGRQTRAGKGVAMLRGWGSSAQKAMRPPAGMYRPPVLPDPNLCYLPDTNLLFDAAWSADGNLVFICERHSVTPPATGETVVVPVLRIYMVFNNISLRRVEGNIALPCSGFTLSLDEGSWAWGFSAALPGSALADLEPASSGAPVELEAIVNGTAFRLLVEGIGRERTFGKNDLRVQGRGKTALLDGPYAPVRNFGNTADRTAQQLMGDVLTVNGVPMDWALIWGLDDWLVPVNVFAHQGSYISALNTIAAAAGGYIQPHAALQTLDVLARYPVAPWQWDTVTPDFELPAAVTTREAIEWVERARYNRVFVSGQQSGILGQVTRAGSAGDLLAPMVTDALITTASAARQRGISVLGNTGRQANITLRLPVLAETGVITPGKFVSYVDAGIARLGIVRSVNVDAGYPEVWQSIGVETHV